MKIGQRLFINFGKAAKWDGSPMIDNPRHGYNWFYYRPHFRTNKGNPFKKEVLDVSFSWLCFWVGLTWCPAWVKKQDVVNAYNAYLITTQKE